MFNRKNLLYVAAAFTLITFVGHTAGTILPKPQDNETLVKAQEIMKQAIVPLPGAQRSLYEMMLGANVFMSVLFLLSGLIFILLARRDSRDNQLLMLNTLATAAGAVASAIWFFPVPTTCLGLAAVFGFLASRK